MAYRTEVKKTVKEAMGNLVEFLTNPVSMETDRSLAQGNGNIEEIGFNRDNVETETWELRYDAGNDVFKVSGSVSGDKADAHIDEYYDNDIIHFTIRQGDEEWQDGDKVLIKVVRSSNPPFNLVGKGWYSDLSIMKCSINGTYGYSLSYYSSLERPSMKENPHNFTLIANKYGLRYDCCGDYYHPYWGVGNGGYNHPTYISCNSLNATSHKIEGDVTIIYNSVLQIANGGCGINSFSVENYTSDNNSSEHSATLSVNDMEGHLSFLGETFDLSAYANTYSDKLLRNIVLTVDSANGYLSIYVDGQKVVDNVQNDKWKNIKALWGKKVTYPITDGMYVYNRVLTEEEITAIYNNGGHPTEELSNYYYGLVTNVEWKPYVFLQSNKYGFLFIKGTNIYWYPTIPYMYSNDISFPLPALSQLAFGLFNENDYGNSPYSMRKPAFHFGNYQNVNDTIERYWYVTDGSSLAIAIKKYDPAILDHPTYQMFYIGWGEGDTAYDFPFVLGWGGSNAYDENSNSFRFGYMYDDNTSFWNGEDWVNNYASGNSLSSEWQNIRMSDNQFSVIQVTIRHNDTQFGYPKWYSLINTTDLQPETEVYISGDKYIVLPDNHKKAPYNYLLKMDKE